MATPKSLRRLVFAGGLAAAVVIAPTAAVALTLTSAQTIAEANGCTASQNNGSYALACAPTVLPNSIGGAPSESELTTINEYRSHNGQ